MKFFQFAIVLFLVAACGDRTLVRMAPEAAGIGTSYKTYVATLRTRTEDGWFSGDRAEKLSYVDVDVSVPPIHQSGKIKYRAAVVDPERQFTITGRKDYSDASAFSAELRRALMRQKPGERDVMLYVHGYNNSFADGVLRSTQLMHDFKLPGVGVHFSWPSAAHPLAYTYDRDSVMFARDALEQFLRQVSNAGPDRIVLVGHSLGSMMVMETLRQIELTSPHWTRRNLGGVILVAPDLDVEVFKQQAKRFDRLPEPFIIFVSERDRALQLSKRVNGDKKRLGLLSNAEEVSDLPVTIVDVSSFADGMGTGHFTLFTSPLLIELMRNSQRLGNTFSRDAGGRTGLLPGTALTVQNATTLILTPLMLSN